MNYLLDTNSAIDHLRKGSASNVTKRMQVAAPGSILLCSVVVGELRFGAMNSGTSHQARNLALLGQLRLQLVSLPFDDAAADQYGDIRAYLSARGTPIGPNDLMIASIALANHVTLVTHNTAEFCRIPGLLIEDWQ